MYLVLLFTAAALFGSTCRSASVHKHINLLSDYENNIAANVGTRSASARKFLTITQRPSSTYAHEPGTTLTLTCNALASPAPSIHWYKNNAPVYEHELESNELIDSNPTSVAHMISTILVPRTIGQDTYTCLVTAGSKTASATTLVYGSAGKTELSERTKLFPLEPHIVVSYKIYVDNIGSNIVLPCRVKGHPRPHITWKDNKDAIVKRDSRMKVLRSGELVITSLRWSDMGMYTCQATNMFGTEMVKTFVYPAKAE